jgi:S-adenosylmethionine synthetase
VADLEPAVVEIVDRELADVTSITRQVIDGDLTTF